MLNEEYRDMLQALDGEKAGFVLVRAYAMAAHGYPRATTDIDIWVMPSPAVCAASWKAGSRSGSRRAGRCRPFGSSAKHSWPVEEAVCS